MYDKAGYYMNGIKVYGLLFAIFSTIAFAYVGDGIQAQISRSELAFYCDAMANTMDGKNRQYAYDKFISAFERILYSDGSIDDDFSDLKWISVKYSEDKTFRVITIQLVDSMNIHHYSGYIQLSDGKTYRLNNVRKKDKDMEFEQMNTDEWYGALYYNIMQVERAGKPFYLLFGYDGNNGKTKRKILDVLSFEDGLPIFGAEIIKEKREGARDLLRNRIILEYAADANVNLNYNPGLNAVIHDFLVPRMDFHKQNEYSLVPDGTYVAYEWDGNFLVKIEMLPIEASDPKNIFFKPKPSDDKDLFGREKSAKTKKRRQ